MRTVVLCVTLLAVVVPSRTGAQVLTLTEAEALSRLSPNNPRLRAIQAGLDLARIDVRAAGRWPNPRVMFDREAVAGVAEGITTVTQLLPITGRRAFDVRAASSLVEAGANRAADLRRRARADVRVSFAHLLAAQVRERELAEARDRLRALADILARREAAGDVSGFDRLRAEREVMEVEADLAASATDRLRSQAALASLLDEIVEPSRVVAVPTALPSADWPPVEVLLERALSTREELLALGKEVDAAQWARRAADRRRVPEPEVVGGTKASNFAGGDVGTVLAIQAVVPLFDRGRIEHATAEARAAQAERKAEVFRLAVRAEITALRTEIDERRATTARYRTSALSSAAQIERIAHVSYDAGERGILELLDAHRIGSAARLRQVSLELAARLAEIELEYVSGWEMPS